MLGLQQQLAAQGWASVAINWRGCSGEPNLLPRAYHSGASDDLAEVIGHLQASRPMAPLHAVGYSLGGNVLLKYLGETGASCLLRKAAAVSVPYRLDQCADRIGPGFSRVYRAHFMKAMVAYVRDKQQRFQREGLLNHLGALQSLGPLHGMRTFWDFDGRFTAPLHGYSDARLLPPRLQPLLPASDHDTNPADPAADDPFVFRHSVPEPTELSATTTTSCTAAAATSALSKALHSSPATTRAAYSAVVGRLASPAQHEGFVFQILETAGQANQPQQNARQHRQRKAIAEEARAHVLADDRQQRIEQHEDQAQLQHDPALVRRKDVEQRHEHDLNAHADQVDVEQRQVIRGNPQPARAGPAPRETARRRSGPDLADFQQSLTHRRSSAA